MKMNEDPKQPDAPIRRRGFPGLAPIALIWVLLVAGCFDSDPDSSQSSSVPPEVVTTGAALSTALNVIVITLDTTRADALGSYGQALPTSPTLDRLAEQGTRFVSCTTSAPSTLPSHSSIFTGKHPHAHGARANSGHVLSEANQTLAEVLKTHGYATGAEIAAPVIGSHTQLDQGFDLYRDLKFSDVAKKSVTYAKKAGPAASEIPEREASDITKHGIRFLQQHRNEKFFLWLHYFDAHQPYSPPLRFFELVGNSDYHGEIRYIDEQIDRVLSELEGLGLSERTLIVVTADHGEGRGQHSEPTHVFFVYDTTIRVPLLMWGPPIPAGLEIEAPVRTIDIAPTILDLLDLPPFDVAQGVSLRPLLTGASQDMELVGYGASVDPYMVFDTSIVRFLRVGRWKYIHKVNPELYDVVSDPGELNNRLSGEPEIAQRMQAQLRELIANAPPSPSDSQQPIDAAAAAQLEALGYIVAESSETLGDELELLELSGDDPNEKVDDMKLIASGMGKMKAEDFEGAAEMLRQVVDHNPNKTPTMMKLIAALKELDEADERRDLLERVIALSPDQVFPYVALAEMNFIAGDLAMAESLLVTALEKDPCAAVPRATLAYLADQQKDHRRRVAVLRAGLGDCNPSDEFLNNYAYALATTPVDEDRDGVEALRIATQITRGPKGNRADYLDTLAAAYAETGEFDRALKTAKRGIALLESAGAEKATIAEARAHLAQFESKQPVRAD
jgi:arylsulfatase A-like enzyme/Tfp pilus assembly protein PilF